MKRAKHHDVRSLHGSLARFGKCPAVSKQAQFELGGPFKPTEGAPTVEVRTADREFTLLGIDRNPQPPDCFTRRRGVRRDRIDRENSLLSLSLGESGLFQSSVGSISAFFASPRETIRFKGEPRSRSGLRYLRFLLFKNPTGSRSFPSAFIGAISGQTRMRSRMLNQMHAAEQPIVPRSADTEFTTFRSVQNFLSGRRLGFAPDLI
jgi:hypothetical protein